MATGLLGWTILKLRYFTRLMPAVFIDEDAAAVITRTLRYSCLTPSKTQFFFPMDSQNLAILFRTFSAITFQISRHPTLGRLLPIQVPWTTHYYFSTAMSRTTPGAIRLLPSEEHTSVISAWGYQSKPLLEHVQQLQSGVGSTRKPKYASGIVPLFCAMQWNIDIVLDNV